MYCTTKFHENRAKPFEEKTSRLKFLNDLNNQGPFRLISYQSSIGFKNCQNTSQLLNSPSKNGRVTQQIDQINKAITFKTKLSHQSKKMDHQNAIAEPYRSQQTRLMRNSFIRGHTNSQRQPENNRISYRGIVKVKEFNPTLRDRLSAETQSIHSINLFDRKEFPARKLATSVKKRLTSSSQLRTKNPVKSELEIEELEANRELLEQSKKSQSEDKWYIHHRMPTSCTYRARAKKNPQTPVKKNFCRPWSSDHDRIHNIVIQ